MAPVLWARVGLFFLMAGLIGCGAGERKEAAEAEVAQKAASTQNGTEEQRPNGAIAQSSVGQAQPPAPEIKKPTIFAARDLARVLDLRKLGAPEGTKVNRHDSANLDAKIPGKVPEVAAFFITKLNAMGWTEEKRPGVAYAIKDDYAEVTVAKDGHTAFMSIGDLNGKELMVNISFYGNFDTRILPRSEGTKVDFASPRFTTYTPTSSVAAESDFIAKKLTADGWQAFTSFNSDRTTIDDSRSLMYRKQGYLLNVSVRSIKAKDTHTIVAYTINVLAHELPAPPEAVNVEFDDEVWKMRCAVPSNLKTAIAFYTAAMPAAGYQPLPSSAATDTSADLRYGTDEKDIVLIQLRNKDGQTTNVQAFGVPAAILEADRKKREGTK
jgi:hypothetical protein